MGNESDPTLLDDVRKRLGDGVSAEPAPRIRLREAAGWLLFLVVMGSNAPSRGLTTTAIDLVSAALVLAIVAIAARRSGELSPPCAVPTEEQVKLVASQSERCRRCRTVVLPRDGGGCPKCRALTWGTLLTVAAVVVILLANVVVRAITRLG